MATANRRLVTALRVTAARIDSGTYYKWTHMGACNCGHLAQTLTALPPDEIRRRALEKAGEWADQALEYCPDSGLVIDHVLGTMLEVGLSPSDIGHLEKLSGPEVLRSLPPDGRRLDHRRRGDVVRYMRAWAGLLEAELGQPGAAPSGLARPIALATARASVEPTERGDLERSVLERRSPEPLEGVG